MLFKSELIEAIVQGKKTQTRRPVKHSDALIEWDDADGVHQQLVTVSNNRQRIKIECGKDYAVCPGRGKPGVMWIPNTGELCYPGDDGYAEIAAAWKHITLDTSFAPPGEGFEFLRIRVLGIQREDVRDILWLDALAEGFVNRSDFWRVWCEFYDKPGLAVIEAHRPHDVIIQAGLRERPDDLYQAWAYVFEVTS